NRIRWEWFATYDAPLSRDAYQSIVQSWDTAMTAEPTSDWSVGMTFGFHASKWHLLDVVRRRLDYPELKRQVIRLARQWQPDTIIIEDAATGKPLYQELRSEKSCGARLHLYKPTIDKEARVEAATGKLEAGLIVVPVAAAWLAELRSELLGFPNKKYDDQVDALTQFLHWTGSRACHGRQQRDPVTGRPVGQRLMWGRDRTVAAPGEAHSRLSTPQL
ncbi:MAG: phage terminase large subunit, partial [Janthinobacterium lividum]